MLFILQLKFNAIGVPKQSVGICKDITKVSSSTAGNPTNHIVASVDLAEFSAGTAEIALVPVETFSGAPEITLSLEETSSGAVEITLVPVESSSGAPEITLVPVESSSGAAEITLGLVETSLGAAEITLGAIESSTGVAGVSVSAAARISLGGYKMPHEKTHAVEGFLRGMETLKIYSTKAGALAERGGKETFVN